MAKHRYGNYPGAWCLDCGAPDPVEVAMQQGPSVWYAGPRGVEWVDDRHAAHLVVLTICAEPGSRRFDPLRTAIPTKPTLPEPYRA